MLVAELTGRGQLLQQQGSWVRIVDKADAQQQLHCLKPLQLPVAARRMGQRSTEL